jgi:hypothetical protein
MQKVEQKTEFVLKMDFIKASMDPISICCDTLEEALEYWEKDRVDIQVDHNFDIEEDISQCYIEERIVVGRYALPLKNGFKED